MSAAVQDDQADPESESPYDRYDLDPSAGPEAITERFRELMAEAPDSQRDALRAAWERLTLHPEARVRAAFFTHPETRPPLGEAPRRRRAPIEVGEPRVTLAGLLVLPALTALLPEGSAPAPDRIDALENDPVLAEK